MNKYLTQSSEIKHEYCCTVVRIGELIPIEGKDKIVQTYVNGMSMVVRKDQVKEGDIMIYAMNETVLNERFLSANNLYEFSEYERNSNAAKVRDYIEQCEKSGETADVRQYCGFFNKYGRVKLLRLGGTPSYGYLFRIDEMARVWPDVINEDLESMVGEDFDTVCGELFVKVYIPYIKPQSGRGANNKRNSKLKEFDVIIPGTFNFHYDTQQLARCIDRIHPEDVVDISVKVHGTSFIAANIPTNQPRWGGLYKKFFLFLPKFLQFTKPSHSLVYSSRNVIKNKYINDKAKHYYGSDVWGHFAELLDGKIPQDFTVYGEIVGYVPGTSQMIQKDYDYGCKSGESKLMIYRVTHHEKTKCREYDIDDVIDFTNDLIKRYPDIAAHIMCFPRVYHGTLAELYPDIKQDEGWSTNILEAMRKDKNVLGMEMNEPLCKNKVPREGVVLRIVGDPAKEAFKLKTDKFFARESKMMDDYKGEDIEMNEQFQ